MNLIPLHVSVSEVVFALITSSPFLQVVLERVVFINTLLFLLILIEFDDCLITLPVLGSF
ncbi:hypothetical protein KN1_00260 [Stygiolobus caldivivus]|uniref:Uncharacterized protein n=1 Tax=Stygiolobus caldivivus TaxID=2824673 RepID=A0A8D5ZGE4_9CREN|nr:hypothetical protein KN1_00260 [Stygiolobus caldivivus]